MNNNWSGSKNFYMLGESLKKFCDFEPWDSPEKKTEKLGTVSE